MDTSFITVNANSSVRIDAGDKVIYIDPFQITDSAGDADYIFLTHEHYDHYSPEAVETVKKTDTVFVYPKGMDKKIKKGAHGGVYYPVAPGQKYDAKGLNFETVASYNKLKQFHPKKCGNCGYLINVNGKKIYIAGDMDATDEAKAVRCDIAIVPIGGFYTMDYKEAAKLINIIKPGVAIPTHYGDVAGKPTDGEEFAKLVDDGIQVDIKLKV